MHKKYTVRLSDEERGVCQEIVKRLKGTSEKVKRAQMLLKADADGPEWSDVKIAEPTHWWRWRWWRRFVPRRSARRSKKRHDQT